MWLSSYDPLVILLFNCLLCQEELGLARLVILLVLNGHLAEMGDDVLHECVALASLLAAEVVQRLHVCHDIVDNSNDNHHGDRVAPHDHDGDNVGAARSIQEPVGRGRNGVGVRTTSKPTKDGKQRGQDVHTKDSKNKLERRVGLEATSDKDEPVLSERHLEEEDTLDVAVVLNNTTLREPKSSTQNPGANGQQRAEHNGDDPDLGQLPLDGTAFKVGIVVCNSNGGQISKQREENDQVDTDGLVDGDHRCDQVKLQVQAEGDTVLDISLHALENLSGDLDSRDNGGQTRGKENDVGSSLGSLSGTLNSYTAVGLLQGGGIVDTVTSHCTKGIEH